MLRPGTFNKEEEDEHDNFITANCSELIQRLPLPSQKFMSDLEMEVEAVNAGPVPVKKPKTGMKHLRAIRADKDEEDYPATGTGAYFHKLVAKG